MENRKFHLEDMHPLSVVTDLAHEPVRFSRCCLKRNHFVHSSNHRGPAKKRTDRKDLAHARNKWNGLAAKCHTWLGTASGPFPNDIAETAGPMRVKLIGRHAANQAF